MEIKIDSTLESSLANSPWQEAISAMQVRAGMYKVDVQATNTVRYKLVHGCFVNLVKQEQTTIE